MVIRTFDTDLTDFFETEMEFGLEGSFEVKRRVLRASLKEVLRRISLVNSWFTGARYYKVEHGVLSCPI